MDGLIDGRAMGWQGQLGSAGGRLGSAGGERGRGRGQQGSATHAVDLHDLEALRDVGGV